MNINWDSPVVQGADESQKWDFVRVHRDRLLAESDWTLTPDAPTDKQAWTDYRQALRDLPASGSDPESLVWPVAPAV